MGSISTPIRVRRSYIRYGAIISLAALCSGFLVSWGISHGSKTVPIETTKEHNTTIMIEMEQPQIHKTRALFGMTLDLAHAFLAPFTALAWSRMNITPIVVTCGSESDRILVESIGFQMAMSKAGGAIVHLGSHPLLPDPHCSKLVRLAAGILGTHPHVMEHTNDPYIILTDLDMIPLSPRWFSSYNTPVDIQGSILVTESNHHGPDDHPLHQRFRYPMVNVGAHASSWKKMALIPDGERLHPHTVITHTMLRFNSIIGKSTISRQGGLTYDSISMESFDEHALTRMIKSHPSFGSNLTFFPHRNPKIDRLNKYTFDTDENWNTFLNSGHISPDIHDAHVWTLGHPDHIGLDGMIRLIQHTIRVTNFSPRNDTDVTWLREYGERINNLHRRNVPHT